MVRSDFETQIRDARHRLEMSQMYSPPAVGAARKTVVCQWESRKHFLAIVLCKRVEWLKNSLEISP